MKLRLLPWILAAICFAPGLGGQFVLDDLLAIVTNPVVTGQKGAHEAFLRTFWGRPLHEPPTAYRPLTTLLFRLEHAVLGPSPLGFHAVGLALYLALVWAAFRLARLYLEERAAALAISLFAVCPLHVENVTSLVGAADMLALLASLGALLLLSPTLGGGPAPSVARTLGAAGLQGLALLSKEGAATWPAVAAVLLVCSLPPGAPWRQRLRRLGPALWLGGVTLGYLLLRVRLLPLTFHNPIPDDVLAGASVGARVRFALGLLASYARLLAVPLDLCTGRKYAEVALPQTLDGAAVAGAVLLGAALWVTLRQGCAGRPPWLLCALICFSLYSSLLFPVPEAMADRFMLAPSLFLSLWLGPALAQLARGGTARRALLVLLLGSHGALAAAQTRVWRTTLTLLEHSVVACPNSIHNHVRLADELSRVGRHAEAAWHYAVARAGRAHFPHPWSHPAREAELDLPPQVRLARLPELLGATEPADRYRARLAAFLMHLGRPQEARLVRLASELPLAPENQNASVTPARP
ncbi:MAG: hypothetical protein RMK29_11185 [Myxococcales bacterium]|nr:hypothetical protein [Myxococcales bacterium]